MDTVSSISLVFPRKDSDLVLYRSVSKQQSVKEKRNSAPDDIRSSMYWNGTNNASKTTTIPQMRMFELMFPILSSFLEQHDFENDTFPKRLCTNLSFDIANNSRVWDCTLANTTSGNVTISPKPDNFSAQIHPLAPKALGNPLIVLICLYGSIAVKDNAAIM
mmetsp:Transcript_3370/g.7888  ORF Transcript_3370/g.7888 Transcript_3370/m.7888 type:complete len:162 (-) Transcript_3370:1018-1503(-)